MTLKEIEIENIRGIEKYSFKLDILPNRPSILVAPNGFGKTSFATAFSSLQVSHSHKYQNRSKLLIKYQDSDGKIIDLEASNTVNSIKDYFDYFVINNRIEAKVSLLQEIVVCPVTLVETIPERVKFTYHPKSQKHRFGTNGKILPNINSVLSNLILIRTILERPSLLEDSLTNEIQRQIGIFIDEINQRKGKNNEIIQWIEDNRIDFLANIACLNELADLILRLELYDLKSKAFLAIIQLMQVYRSNKDDFMKACEYRFYELEKKNYKELLESFNSSWKNICLKEKKGSLIVEFPEFKSISNGERDVLSFVALLEQAKRILIKNNGILIIDEIFDCLDSANLIALQYYITQMIEEYKLMGKKIYPLILTHLDPELFKSFVFSKQRVYYLNRSEFKVEPNLINLLCKREEPNIKDDVSKYLLHYNPCCINKRSEFRILSLKETWGEGYNFDEFLQKEMDKYLAYESEYDPLAVCCALRKRIEEKVYVKINSDVNKKKFLDTRTTSKKLEFAEEIGIDIPEIFYLLGVIYNDAMHWRHNLDNVSPVASKLENRSIKYLIQIVFSN